MSAAIVQGDAALLLLPRASAVGVGEVLRVLASAVVASRLELAAPDPRCSEPLLLLGEALARSGALSLASLPPELRPVKDWIDEKEAGSALSMLVRMALDEDVAWATRRARLQGLGQPGGANPQLGHAAAALVEAFGKPAEALHRPFDFLLAWQAQRDRFPIKAPGALKRALAQPLDAGMPAKKLEQDREAIANLALERAVAAGPWSDAALLGTAPLALRLQAAARARREGRDSLCSWLLAGPVPAALRTGCRSEGEAGGVVFAKASAGMGFDVVWRGVSGEEALLLQWPKWLLFPVLATSRSELWFIDADGIWRVALDGREAPRKVVGGSFRRLAVSPDGSRVATTRWPYARALVVTPEGGVTELDGVAPGGFAWLDIEVVIASDGSKLSLLSLGGGKREGIGIVDCTTALEARGSAVFVATVAPCTPGLIRVDLASGETTGLARLTEGAAGLALLPDASLVFSAVDGLHRWRGGNQAERLTAGLTPGPG